MPLRVALLTLLAVTAFAANSLLNRAALASGEIDPGAFTVIRMVSGALTLAALVAWSGGGGNGGENGDRTPLARLRRSGTVISALALLAYAVFFSYAYLTLEAGLGALLLFSAVQITMMAVALFRGERPRPMRWLGIAAAFAGFVFLVAPTGAAAPDLFGAALMTLAGAAWGVYSLRGSGGKPPLEATAGNFLIAAPISLALLALIDFDAPMTGAGVALAVASGAVASGMGYAVWFAALKHLEASVAAIAQLLAPLIAVAASIAFLGEEASLRVALAAALILGGVALAVKGGSRKA